MTNSQWKFQCNCGHSWQGLFPTEEEGECPACEGIDFTMVPACWKTNAARCRELLPS